jgi:DNA-binding MarR family transcriptional regulator
MTTPDPATSAPAPPALTGRDIGAAAKATGALLGPLLDAADLPFEEWTVLFTLAGTGPVRRRALIAQQAGDLKVPESTTRATVDGMVAAGLIAPAEDADVADADDPRLAPTAAGLAVYQPIREQVNQIAAELYGDLPPDDLVATRRTLDEVTRRANARLATAAPAATGAAATAG